MILFVTTEVEPTGLYKQWQCFAKSYDRKYHPEAGYPCYGSPSMHHVIVSAGSRRSAERRIQKILRRASKRVYQ